MIFSAAGLPGLEERAIFAVTLSAVKLLPYRTGNIRRIKAQVEGA